MIRSIVLRRVPLAALGLMAVVACTDKLLAPQPHSLTPHAAGFDKSEQHIGDGSILTATLSAHIRMFDTTGKLIGERALSSFPVQTRFVNGTAKLALPLRKGVWTKAFVLGEALHGKHHGKGHLEKSGPDAQGRNWYVGSDGEPRGGPMGAALIAIDGKPSAGTMSHYNRVEGGWTLNRTTTTIYDANGRPAYTISMDVSNATIAAVSTAQMSFGGAAQAVRQVGDALANALLPAVAAAQDGGTFDTNAGSDGSSDGSSGAGRGVPK